MSNHDFTPIAQQLAKMSCPNDDSKVIEVTPETDRRHMERRSSSSSEAERRRYALLQAAATLHSGNMLSVTDAIAMAIQCMEEIERREAAVVPQ